MGPCQQVQYHKEWILIMAVLLCWLHHQTDPKKAKWQCSNVTEAPRCQLSCALTRGPINKGRRHEILIGLVRLIGTQTHLPPKFSFSSDFGNFILKMLENARMRFFKRNFQSHSTVMPTSGYARLYGIQMLYVSRKTIMKYLNFWGSTPRFLKVGVLTPATPPPPSATPLPITISWSMASHKLIPTKTSPDRHEMRGCVAIHILRLLILLPHQFPCISLELFS